jgi:hypothetical protein
MKILTFKRLIGIGVIGGVAYVHKQRGGEWTLASLGDTLKYLWSSARKKLEPMKREMRDTLDRGARMEDSGARGRRPDDRTSVPYREDKGKGDVGPH